ncbi:uncharacterized protein LOC122562284 isoform X4 [Chiloscyllium plagiosum]|uniref:uncharacterized protein LOC122562284 isoform X4 n=1 Tax=Chiloscyllium plagiosum TaxID=36176 RepID=UPI001CB8817C|nr:uncharacterized protein LOC122562284 isoform X4 [Chiloscyllium plagiosum]
MYRKISEFGCSSWDPKLQSLGIFGKNREDAPCRFRRSLVSLLAAAAWVSEIRAGRPWKQDGTRSGNSCAQDPGIKACWYRHRHSSLHYIEYNRVIGS